ncbi:hypothetical protein BKA82DRAFT_1008447 [Pisolithus tinctorius]|uniref:DNAJ-containing protein X-domain domain-containing protein n=1 Tax=Pisolithus tinctorius Marx 270 TaxID=870435 RepID=A0A0C3J9I3_PISTI|nr:hypothetical protein BKA82DRAFT_1008447 [Pisolithus tinctorius]KIN94321.1 hypothetical protein M404DRAFT_1008447 [Pisolithus tinctorius Marx 270]
MTTKDAIKYFSAMFGIEHFENYVGKITFFKKLATGLELNSDTPEVVPDSSISGLVKALCRRMDNVYGIPRQQMQGIQGEIAAISKTLGIKLLEEMAAIYTQTYHVLCPLKGDLDRSCTEYDMSKPIIELISNLRPQITASKHDNIRNMVEEIKALQTTLDATENIDEQLALEEDITGRILWTCHYGLRSEVGHIPAKVLHSILENDKLCNLLDRVMFLEEISRVFNDALAELPTDDQAHLRRIMADAEAGTSKHKLLFEERKREQRVPGARHEEQTRT